MTRSAAPPPIVLVDPSRLGHVRRSAARRKLRDQAFRWACVGVAALSMLMLAVLLGAILWRGLAHLDWAFLTRPPGPDPTQAGLLPALLGTVWLCVLCGLFTLPLGVAAAVFLEEFRPRRPWLRRVHGFIQLNMANLAGVPSVVYGIIGLTVFVAMFNLLGTPMRPAYEWGVRSYDQFFNEADRVILVPVERSDAPYVIVEPGMVGQSVEGETFEVHVIGPDAPFPEDPALAARTLRTDALAGRISERSWYYLRLPLGRGVLAGALTLMLVVLPIVIIASQEALRAVPDSLREAALGMGTTRWQMVRRVTLPAAVPGIMTGAIIAMSRAIGEAAPLLMIAGIVFISSPPGNVMDDFTALPLQIYNWAQRPQEAFHQIAAAGIIVLLAVLLSFNLAAVLIRQKFQKPLS